MKHIYLVFLILTVFIFGCSTDDTSIDPMSDILGKWELTKFGNGNDLVPNENPAAYAEYLPDSILRIFSYEDERFTFQKYWIEGGFLTEVDEFIVNTSMGNDTIILEFKYKIEFLNKNSFKRDLQSPALTTTSIYERLN